MTDSRPWAIVVLSWVAMIGIDLFLHAGLLAPLYDWDSPFLLTPGDAFARIPVGYLSFLLLAFALFWLLRRLDVRRGCAGMLFGGGFGVVVWGALLLGLWSIATAEPALLAGWWVGQSAELAVGGLVTGSLLGGAAVRPMAWKVAALLVVGAATAVMLQTIGYAPAPDVIR